MEDINEIGGFLALSTMVQLQVCLKALDMMGCGVAALHVDAALNALKEDLETVKPRGRLFRPDEDFAEMDAMVDEMFRRRQEHARY